MSPGSPVQSSSDGLVARRGQGDEPGLGRPARRSARRGTVRPSPPARRPRRRRRASPPGPDRRSARRAARAASASRPDRGSRPGRRSAAASRSPAAPRGPAARTWPLIGPCASCGQATRRPAGRASDRPRSGPRPASIGRLPSVRGDPRPARLPASRASTGLCSASGRIGPTSISRCRPSIQRSRNVRSSEQRRRRPSAPVARSIEPAAIADQDQPERRRLRPARGRRSSRAARRSSGRRPTSGARPTAGSSARQVGVARGLARLGHHRIGRKLGSPYQGMASNAAIEPPARPGASRVRSVLRSASSIRPSDGQRSTSAATIASRRSDAPGPRPLPPAVESLPRQQRQRQATSPGSSAPGPGRRRSPAAGSGAGTPARRARGSGTSVDQRQDRQQPDRRHRGGTRAPSPCTARNSGTRPT